MHFSSFLDARNIHPRYAFCIFWLKFLFENVFGEIFSNINEIIRGAFSPVTRLTVLCPLGTFEIDFCEKLRFLKGLNLFGLVL